MKQTLRKLYITYYMVFAAMAIAASSGFYILKSGIHIDPLSEIGTIINSILIIYILGSIPLALAIFNKMTKKWALLEDENQKLLKYKHGAIYRICIIGVGLIISLVFFYIMNSQSMIFCTGIAVIALYFSKPSEIKIINELNLEENKN